MAKKILIVDDDRNLGLLYQQELEDDGYEVVFAENGRDALLKVESENPDLVVMDIAMPEMDGIEALEKLLAQDHHMPVILNTAYSSFKNNFMSWAADAYLVKSGDLSELKGKIEELLAGRYHRKKLAAKQMAASESQI